MAQKDSNAVKEALDQLKEDGWAHQWSSQPYVSRRTTSVRELTTLGIKNAENLAIPSVRNDAAFLFTVVGTTGFLGVLAGRFLEIGASCSIFDWEHFSDSLGSGSISPGKARYNRTHESSPFYKLEIRNTKLLMLAVVAMAGLAAEGLQYDKVVGQSADLFTLQVLFAGSLIKNNKVLHEALMKAMSNKMTVLECIEAIEKAA
ncbi:hypothetical protein GH714_019830 [Hevea brasiliensis]|uniref:Uncharacterized protein n=1 Tax=Hevea brasiliensis TaxID=3981 RepID=A0A6A6K5V9_HEVBR|nr:hypothetical protein GH714_019830 [Hevea brasiliensis]